MIVNMVITFYDLWVGVIYGSTPPVFITYLELVGVMTSCFLCLLLSIEFYHNAALDNWLLDVVCSQNKPEYVGKFAKSDLLQSINLVVTRSDDLIIAGLNFYFIIKNTKLKLRSSDFNQMVTDV